MKIRNFEQGRCFLARLDLDAEIISQITDLARREGIETGVFSVIGALKHAELACYDQTAHEYRTIKVDRPVELVSCSGNVSIRDGQPFVHAHAVLADSEGMVRSGHLMKGEVFAAELCLQELLGPPLIREHDPATGLYLWGDR
jgi:predicted DNA-binding protein with PD1-like motif